jgi:hypothetical protein
MSEADGSEADDSRAADGETQREQINRELMELLNELRVALPGVQFLFAFLLIVPFQQTVVRLTDFQRGVHYVALLSAAVATALLIAPAAQHRVLFRQQDKENLLKRSNRSAVAGLLALGLAISSAILLVVDVLYSRTQAWWTAGTVGALLLWWWALVPFWMRARSAQDGAGN